MSISWGELLVNQRENTMAHPMVNYLVLVLRKEKRMAFYLERLLTSQWAWMLVWLKEKM